MMAGDPVMAPLISAHAAAGRRTLRRALAGLTWQRVAMVAVLCLLWALSVTTHESLVAWHEGEFLAWLVDRPGKEFASIATMALAGGAVMLVAGNLGPQAGWRRVALLASTLLFVAAPLAMALRVGYHLLAGMGSAILHPFVFFTLWERYAEMLGLFTLVAEFQRREARSIASMHRAELDRIALDREMAEARLQVLQAQIEPHFLFNTLANVRRLYQVDAATGRTMLRNLMHYLEVALPHMLQSRSTVGAELALVEAYLNVQRIRMGHRLSFCLDVPVDLRDIELPPMMLLTLVENAIKHGLNPRTEGGRLVVAARIEADRLRIDVVDDGRGFQASSGGGTGLANIRARLAAMYGGDAALRLTENQPRGVTSTLSLPLSRRPGP